MLLFLRFPHIHTWHEERGIYGRTFRLEVVLCAEKKMLEKFMCVYVEN